MICPRCNWEADHLDWIYGGLSKTRVSNAVAAYERLIAEEKSPWLQLKKAFVRWLESTRYGKWQSRHDRTVAFKKRTHGKLSHVIFRDGPDRVWRRV